MFPIKIYNNKSVANEIIYRYDDVMFGSCLKIVPGEGKRVECRRNKLGHVSVVENGKWGHGDLLKYSTFVYVRNFSH